MIILPRIANFRISKPFLEAAGNFLANTVSIDVLQDTPNIPSGQQSQTFPQSIQQDKDRQHNINKKTSDQPSLESNQDLLDGVTLPEFPIDP